MACPDYSVTLSVRIPSESRDQLEELSEATGRTKSFLAAEAIENYLAAHVWQVMSTKKALEKADSSNAQFVDHDKVVEWLKSWDSDDELDMPK